MKSAKTVIAILALIFVSFVVYKNYGAVKSGVDLDNFNQDDGRVMAPVDLMLTVGETAEATGLSLTFNSIVQDDRCPSDAKCQEGGAVTVSLTLTTDNQTETLNYSSDGVPLSFGGYNIAIVEVMPKLLLNTEISPNDYIVTFNVSSAYTDIVDNPDVAGEQFQRVAILVRVSAEHLMLQMANVLESGKRLPRNRWDFQRMRFRLPKRSICRSVHDAMRASL